jgi:hypothetical protein
MREGAEMYDMWHQQDNARPHTSATTTDAIAVWGLQCYDIQPTPWILLLAISTCSAN